MSSTAGTLLIAAVLLVDPLSRAGHATTKISKRSPHIVEFGPTFRSRLGYGLAVAPDGSAWAVESDGVAHIYADGRVVQTRRGRECDRCVPSPGVVVAPDGSAYVAFLDGFPRRDEPYETDEYAALVRFVDGRATVARAVLDYGQAPMAAAASALYVARASRRGLQRIDPDGNEADIMPSSGFVRAISVGTDGTVWTIAASGEDRYGEPYGPTSAAFSSGSAVRSDLARAYVTSHELSALDVAPDGSLLAQSRFSDLRGNAKLVRIRQDGVVRALAEIPNSRPRFGGAIAQSIGGNVWYSEPTNNRIERLDPDGTIHVIRDGIPSGAEPFDLALGPDESVWFTDTGRNTVGRVGSDGSMRVFGNGLRPDNVPGGPAVTDDGSVWFRETLSWHARIARIDAGGTLHEFVTHDGDRGPDPFAALSAAGHDVVSIGDGHDGRPTLREFRPDGSSFVRNAANCFVARASFACFSKHVARPLRSPLGIPDADVLGPDGNIWFTDSARGAVGRVTPTGEFRFFTRGLTRGRSFPRYIVCGPHDTLWFTEMGDRIGRITTDGRIEEFTGIPHRASVGGIVAGRDGNLWFTLYHGNELARVTPAGDVTRFRAGIYPSRGNDDAVDSVPFVDRAGRIWFNEPEGGRIARATLP